MSDNREKLIERIRRILALAGNNPNEHERDAAMAKAQALLLDHNISMKEVDHTDDADVKIGEWTQVTRNGQWSRRIAAAVGRLYLAGYLYTSFGKKVQHTFVGTETNCKIASEVSAYVIEVVYREGAIAMRRAGASNAYWTSFVNSASHRIRARVGEMIAAASRSTTKESESRALAVLDLYAQAERTAREYIEAMANVKTAKARPEQFKSLEGWEAGRAFADKVPLNQQVGRGYTDKVRARIK